MGVKCMAEDQNWKRDRAIDAEHKHERPGWDSNPILELVWLKAGDRK
jgi:hypothetical protein